MKYFEKTADWFGLQGSACKGGILRASVLPEGCRKAVSGHQVCSTSLDTWQHSIHILRVQEPEVHGQRKALGYTAAGIFSSLRKEEVPLRAAAWWGLEDVMQSKVAGYSEIDAA